MSRSIIIVGAGAAGLMAAKELSAKGYKVTILEASARLGGRIWTLTDTSFMQPVEAGAEFIHANSALTIQLLHEAGVRYFPVGGKTVHVRNPGQSVPGEDGQWEAVMQKMSGLPQDMTLQAFLDDYFPGPRYAAVRESVRGFAEGFDLADIDKASVFALLEEWSHEGGKQYRIEGGYQRLIDYLAGVCQGKGCSIETDSIVKEIYWKPNSVKIVTENDRSFEAEKAVITVSLGVLQCELNARAAIAFSPSIYDFFRAAKMIGYGSVIKVLLQFEKTFWEKDAGFILTDEDVPTWWTQAPAGYPLLTGWLCAPRSRKLPRQDDATILSRSLASVATMLKTDLAAVKKMLSAHKIINWADQPFVLGGYSYNFPESANAKKIMGIPIQDTLFFAGEGLYEGVARGTVEAALVSGKSVAEKISAL